jgi:phage-related protein
MKGERKPVYWVGSSRRDIRGLPEAARKVIGTTLDKVQEGDKPPNAKPLKGFGSAKILEINADANGEAFRGVYTVKFARAVYVLHVFHKKSKQGIAIPKQDMDLIKSRLRLAEQDHASRDEEEY